MRKKYTFHHDGYLSLNQMADELKVCRQTVSIWCQRFFHKLPSEIQVARKTSTGRYLIPVSEVARITQAVKKRTIEHAKLVRLYPSRKARRVTQQDFTTLARKQKHRCAICHRRATLVVDHSHATGNYRGLLCYACNTGLGLLKDKIFVLQAAIKYLHRYENS